MTRFLERRADADACVEEWVEACVGVGGAAVHLWSMFNTSSDEVDGGGKPP